MFLTTIVVIQSLIRLFGRTIKPKLTRTNQRAVLTIDIYGPSCPSYPSEPQVLRNLLDGVSIAKRLSVGARLTEAVFGRLNQLATELLHGHSLEGLFAESLPFAEINKLLS